METKLKENNIVLCTVKKIEGTTVFVTIENNGEGSIIFPEIAAGRIRNIREYVVPNKKIVCKVLQIVEGHPQLSLRRVTAKEREEILKSYEKEKTLLSILKSLTQDASTVLDKIKTQFQADEFIEKAKQTPKILESFFSKTQTEQEVKKLIILKSMQDSGAEDIKQILKIPDIEIKYLGSSQFMLSKKSPDLKQAENTINQAIKAIQERAKAKKALFELKEK
jgi:translation initiation factor 2 alpha subunit (eIF-2alpha)